MALIDNQTKEKIAIEVIKTLLSRFDKFPEDSSNNRNAPFHEAFLKAFTDKFQDKVPDIPFFISLSSWLHGLNTTLGQTFFENVAHHLCHGEKREYTSKKLGNLNIKQGQRNHISKILADLSNSSKTPNLIEEDNLIFQDNDGDEIRAMDFSTDVFFEDAERVTAIELKSVKPNSGEMKGEKQKILEGKAALYRKFPHKQVSFYIGFPFDPTVNPADEAETSHNKDRFLNSIINMTKFFDETECLVADELWDFLSGKQNTMFQILEVINSISTIEFMEEFRFIDESNNRSNPRYREILQRWCLFSELELNLLDDVLQKRIDGDKTLTRIYNKKPFNKNGQYDFDRYHGLIKAIE